VVRSSRSATDREKHSTTGSSGEIRLSSTGPRISKHRLLLPLLLRGRSAASLSCAAPSSEAMRSPPPLLENEISLCVLHFPVGICKNTQGNSLFPNGF
jgi:hypothetical protein